LFDRFPSKHIIRIGRLVFKLSLMVGYEKLGKAKITQG